MVLAPLMLCATHARVAAQDPFIFHVYVDPIYGDDQLAYRLNPNDGTGPALSAVLASYPPMFPDQSGVQGFLQHAPYSFRTLTGGTANAGFGALGYIDLVFQGDGPWSYNDNTVDLVVIHCLPGLYGPLDAPMATPERAEFDTDPQACVAFPGLGSHLRYNGEAFPIRLRDRISIQGTSALDTIFDARCNTTAIFEAESGAVSNGPAFVDSVTVRGARSNGQGPWVGGNRNTSGAGFYIGRSGPNRLTITNCFIVENSVGIAIENETDLKTPTDVARPTIVNNTIAWNTIGIWSGNAPPPGQQQPRIGIAQPILLNNIIDPGLPNPPSMNVTCLGLHREDLLVSAPVAGSFNAYPDGTLQDIPPAVSVPPNFLDTDAVRRAPAAMDPAPRIDLTPFMPVGGQTRGLLYVADAIRLGSSSLIPERSSHDLRLAPHVALAGEIIDAQNPVTELNPCVNMGLSIGSSSMITTITFENYVTYWDQTGSPPAHNQLTRAPGYAPVPGEPDRFHAWDWDCEGFGNPRVRCREGFPSIGDDPLPGQPDVEDHIDLGADEMDELIISGYAIRTRMFADYPEWILPSAPPPGILRPLFFDLRGTDHPRPLFNVELGRGYNWWEHARDAEQADDAVDITASWLAPPNNVIPSNYTDVSMATAVGLPPQLQPWRNSVIQGLQPTMPPAIGLPFEPVIMRNLWCDFSPTLMGDIHPLWGSTWFASVLPTFFGGDVYAANPWFGEPASRAMVPFSFPQAPNHNWTLYRSDPSTMTAFPGAVLDGTINPPFTWWTGLPLAECGPLDPAAGFLTSQPLGPLGPFIDPANPCIPPIPEVFTVGPFGFGDAQCPPEEFPPLIPFWWGIRFNCQAFPWDETAHAHDLEQGSNLQTFLLVHGDPEWQESQSGQSTKSATAAEALSRWPEGWPTSTVAERRALMQRLMRR